MRIARKAVPKTRYSGANPEKRPPAITNFSHTPHWAKASSIQFSLKVNAPGDQYEQEANRVAEQVMRMRQPTVQRKTTHGAGQPTAPPIVQPALQRPGRPLDNATRNFMESRFGHDFGHVRIHTDSRAASAAGAMNARAFTAGRDVLFGAEQYAPLTKDGQWLLAHELTHIVQQGRGATQDIQREIQVSGSVFGPDKRWLEQLAARFGGQGIEIYNKMRDAGVTYDYLNEDLLLTEIQIRVEAIKRMRETEIDWSCCGYRDAANPHYYLDSAFWEPTSTKSVSMPSAPELDRGSYQPDFRPKAGVAPADAIRAVFKPGAGSILECRSMMVAIQYYAMLQTYGEKKFNTMFGSGNVIVGRYTDPVDPAKARHPLAELKMLIPVDVPVYKGDETANLLPGDWVYFRNHPAYPEDAGDWKGEWAIYMGNGVFSGFGLRKELDMEDVKFVQFAYTYEELKQQLLEQYLMVASPGTTATREEIPGIITTKGMTRVLRPNP